MQARVRLCGRIRNYRERRDIDEKRKEGEEAWRGSVERCQESAAVPLNQWAHEHSRVELMRCWCWPRPTHTLSSDQTTSWSQSISTRPSICSCLQKVNLFNAAFQSNALYIFLTLSWSELTDHFCGFIFLYTEGKTNPDPKILDKHLRVCIFLFMDL